MSLKEATIERREESLIYCRVSNEKQVKEGHGLDTQELRCRDYAKSKNYKVIKVFKEKGVSGGLLNRPAMNNLLEFLSNSPRDKHYIVIFDDIKRLARDTEIHFALKRAITKLGHRVESPNFKFENSPEGKFMETIFAATSALEKDQNARQVVQKMKARLEMGYWCFRSPPLGLSYFRDSFHGKLLRAVPPLSTIYKEAIESYDKGILNTVEETRQFISDKYRKHNINRKTSLNGTRAILTELLYTGYIEYPKWKINRMKGQHEGFINIETYNRVQDKLQGKTKFSPRKDYSLDFPLRGLVVCDSCGKPYTGAWCKGRNNIYPKYWCKYKTNEYKCAEYGHTIKRSTIEKHFIDILQQVKPCDEVLDLTKDIFIDVWNHKSDIYLNQQKNITNEIEKIDKDIDILTQQITLKLSNGEEDMVTVYEEQIKKLRKERKKITAVSNNPSYTSKQFRTANDEVFKTLKNPVAMWQSKEYADKTTIYSMYFDEKLKYSITNGFRTPVLSLPIDLMSHYKDHPDSLVDKLQNNLNQIESYIMEWYYRLQNSNVAAI